MQGFDLSTISDCYIGNNQVSEIWLGQTKIWPTTSPYEREYLTFEALEPTSFSFTYNDLQYSLDNGTTWTTLTTGTSTPILSTGDKIMWKQTGLVPITQSDASHPTVGIGTFSSTGNFNVSGNIMSLHYGDNFNNQYDLTGKDYAFGELFENNKLVNASNLILPATTLAECCYFAMFENCTLLTNAPELPATTLAESCYVSMFDACTSLTRAPELPATTLADDCYQSMFDRCTSLTTAPELPATILADYCYHSMFSNCTSLTTAPELPVTTLADYCYVQMFKGCTSLTTAPELPATTLVIWCYSNMFRDCASLTTAPELPATTLTTGCYSSMFRDCTSLNYIKCMAITGFSSTNCLYAWTENVSSTGTFVKDTNTTWPSGSNGIPNNWTVQNA